LEFRQLETFLKVAELKSFSKAAQEIFLTQPTVSEHIRQLESELNTRLFLRTKRETILTPSGKQFVKHAKKILNLRRQTLLEMGQFASTVEGELIIGASTIPGEYILPQFIGSFRKRFPKIKMELIISDSQRAMEWVLERQCEIAFIGVDPNHKLLTATPFSSDTIAPVINTSHPLAQKTGLSLKDLQTIPLVLRETGSGTRRAVERVLNEKGLSWKSFNVALVVGSATAAINAVLSGPFYSFLSLKSVEAAFEHGRLKQMHTTAFDAIHRQFFMIRGKKDLLSPMAKHFIKHVQPTILESAPS
jgi:DNA-binding transcriptional LysR family regulator